MAAQCAPVAVAAHMGAAGVSGARDAATPPAASEEAGESYKPGPQAAAGLPFGPAGPAAQCAIAGADPAADLARHDPYESGAWLAVGGLGAAGPHATLAPLLTPPASSAPSSSSSISAAASDSGSASEPNSPAAAPDPDHPHARAVAARALSRLAAAGSPPPSCSFSSAASAHGLAGPNHAAAAAPPCAGRPDSAASFFAPPPAGAEVVAFNWADKSARPTAVAAMETLVGAMADDPVNAFLLGGAPSAQFARKEIKG